MPNAFHATLLKAITYDDLCGRHHYWEAGTRILVVRLNGIESMDAAGGFHLETGFMARADDNHWFDVALDQIQMDI